MRSLWEKIERCKYVPQPGSLKGKIDDVISTVGEILHGDLDWKNHHHGHGFDGWLPTSEADPKLVLKDHELVVLLLDAVNQALRDHVGNPLFRLKTRFDPNDTRNAEHSPEGVAFTPLAVENGRRAGPREFLLKVMAELPGHLEIRKHSLVTKVLFDGKKARGVEFINKAHVYKADPNAIDGADKLPREEVSARREVILCGGAFNTPQLLMLSGVGPKDVLEGFGIPVVADLPGVGKNLQDRYEVGVVSEFAADFKLLENCTFAPTGEGLLPDEAMAQWANTGTGVYASNGSLIGLIKRSNKDLKDPDLYIFGLPGYFKGYEPGYSKKFEEKHNRFTWAILKARTSNTGYVSLRTGNPCDRPAINFQYFGDGKRENDPDVEAVASGVNFVREMNHRLRGFGLIKTECVPGENMTGDALRKFIRNEAWGHHASCTAKIGADNDGDAVLDSRFRVRGVENLRVVDASVFPKIPGYFIVSAVYMISEKAAHAIAEDAEALPRTMNA